jgi:hypothetical protein
MTFCTQLCATWKTNYPAHPVSAIAPDGYMHGNVRIGVKRKGGNGAVSVRYLVKPALPSFSASGDYTLDFDADNYPGWSETGDETLATGTGYYNNADEAFDAEVCLVSGAYYSPGPASGYDRQWGKEGTDNDIFESDGTVIHSNSARWQILTWDNNDFTDKYIYLRHGKIATNTTNGGTRWYAVYLTNNEDSHYNLTADGRDGVLNSIRGTSTGLINTSASILPAYTGQLKSDESGLVRGSESSPFFVAISGWSTGQVNAAICTTLYG